MTQNADTVAMSIDWQEVAADLAKALRELHEQCLDPEVSRQQLSDCPDTCFAFLALRRYEATLIDGSAVPTESHKEL